MLSEWTLFFSLFSRFTGFFLLSPLFSERAIPKMIRLGLALTCSLLLAPPLSKTMLLTEIPFSLLALNLLKELIVGYLIGFIFSLLCEAAGFAGQIIGTMAGFSATELIALTNMGSHPLWGRLFSLLAFTFFLIFDFHHLLIRILWESYVSLSSFNAGFIPLLIDTSTRLFHQALSYAIFPLLLLSIVLVCFAIASRILPQLHLFFNGLPIQIFVGFGAIIISLAFFGAIFEESFKEFLLLTKRQLGF